VRRERPPEAYVIRQPRSAFSESLRSLYTSILLTRVDAPPRTVLITSALPREGKSSIALCLARVQARSGTKVVILDADLRRPRLHEALGLARVPGLVELLSGETTIEEALRLDEASGAAVILSGRSIPNPPDLLRSQRLQQLLEQLTQSHDLVVLDSPPVSVASDARIVASLANVTLLVVRWAETRREIVQQALKELHGAGAHVGGVVLSMVDPRRYAQYGYGDSGYYYGRLKKYYGG
jgi:capsular exopolysaccharide synthesis family protein